MLDRGSVNHRGQENRLLSNNTCSGTCLFDCLPCILFAVDSYVLLAVHPVRATLLFLLFQQIF